MFKSLQAGRAAAALGVFAFHLSLAFDDPRFGGARLAHDFTQFGRYGVEFFFALSGFIILFAHRADIGRPDRLSRYAARRVIRIYPMYGLLTLLVVFWAWAAGRPLPSAPLDWLTSASLIRFTPVVPPLLPAWTLFHEVFFYGVFALLILRRWVGWLAAGSWLLAIVLFPPGSAFGGAFRALVVSPINLCFFGGLLAYALHGTLTAARAVPFFLCGIVSFVLVACRGDGPVLPPIGFALAISASLALLISGMVGMERHGLWPDIRWLSRVGDASYTLYLAHGAVMTGLLKLAFVLGLVPVLGRPVLYLLVLGLGTGACVFLHRRVEKPLQQRLVNRFLKRQPARALLVS